MIHRENFFEPIGGFVAARAEHAGVADENIDARETLERALSGTYRLPIETQVDWTRLR